MSTTRTVTVWCDECGWWCEMTDHDAKGAREKAKVNGWAVNLPGTYEPTEGELACGLWMPGKRRDLCPDCRRGVSS